MAQTPEGKVKDWLKAQMKANYPDCWMYMPPGGPFGKIGIHDIEFVIPAGEFCVYVAIEVKSDETRNPTEPQVRNLQHLKRCGAVVALMRGKDKAKLSMVLSEINRRVSILNNLPKVTQ